MGGNSQVNDRSNLEQAFVNGGFVYKGESIGRCSAREECIKNISA